MNRVCIVVNSLRAGGAERTAATLAEHWSRAPDTQVCVVTHSDFRGEDFFVLPPNVERVRIGVPAPRGNAVARAANLVRRVVALRRALRGWRPTAVVALVEMTNLMALVACAGTGIPVVVSERTDPRHFAVSRAVRAARVLLYRAARAVVVQTEGLRGWAEAVARRGRAHVIPNAVRPPVGDGALPLRRPAVIALGRLHPTKGFDLLIPAFAQALEAAPGWTLYVFGEGGERARLEALAARVAPPGAVELPGATPHVDAALRGADLFVLASRVEGFPNALLEAMANGCPVVSVDCDSGPRDIVRDGVDGALVPAGDVAALAGGLARMMSDGVLRARCAAAARAGVARFEAAAVMRRWDALVLAPAQRGPGVAGAVPAGDVEP